MAITTELFDGNGTDKNFTVSSTILSKSNVRIDFFYGSTGSKLDGDAVDHEIDASLWDVLSGTILFKTAPINGYEIRITVSSDGTGLTTAPSIYTDLLTNIGEVVIVANSIDEVV